MKYQEQIKFQYKIEIEIRAGEVGSAWGKIYINIDIFLYKKKLRPHSNLRTSGKLNALFTRENGQWTQKKTPITIALLCLRQAGP